MTIHDRKIDSPSEASLRGAVVGYLASLPPSEWGQIRDVTIRIFGAEYTPPQFWEMHRLFILMKAEGSVVLKSHIGWRAA